MGRTMKTFVMRRIGEVDMMDKPIPEPGPNDAIVKTTAALVCTSDTHTVAGAIGERENLTLGHEAVGVIHKLGSQVEGFNVGDRVLVNAITPCYHCENCLRGFSSQCGEALDRVDPTPMTTHRFPFEEVEEAFTLMKTKADGILKPLILFD